MQHEMRVLGGKGDTKVMWNTANEHEVRAAKRQFKDLVGKKNFAAFRVEKDGEPGERVREFDPEAGKLILIPPMAGGA